MRPDDPKSRGGDAGTPVARRSAIEDLVRALELDAARWQAILDTARDAIVCIDEQGRITLFNLEAERMFGYRLEETLGANVRMLMPSPYHEEHDDYLRRYRATRLPHAIGRIRHVCARRKSGESFPIELSVAEARVGDSVVYSAIIRDVSDRQVPSERKPGAEDGRVERRGAGDPARLLLAVRRVHEPLTQLSRSLRRGEAVDAREASAVLREAARVLGMLARFLGGGRAVARGRVSG